eukprot:10228246-Prorocentrum_lima.AAC.1
MTSSLVGSEMCIRDRSPGQLQQHHPLLAEAAEVWACAASNPPEGGWAPVSYTHLTLPTICSV